MLKIKLTGGFVWYDWRQDIMKYTIIIKKSHDYSEKVKHITQIGESSNLLHYKCCVWEFVCEQLHVYAVC